MDVCNLIGITHSTVNKIERKIMSSQYLLDKPVLFTDSAVFKLNEDNIPVEDYRQLA